MSGPFPGQPPMAWQGGDASRMQQPYLPQYRQWMEQLISSGEQMKDMPVPGRVDPDAWAILRPGHPGMGPMIGGKPTMFPQGQLPLVPENGAARCPMAPRQAEPYPPLLLPMPGIYAPPPPPVPSANYNRPPLSASSTERMPMNSEDNLPVLKPYAPPLSLNVIPNESTRNQLQRNHIEDKISANDRRYPNDLSHRERLPSASQEARVSNHQRDSYRSNRYENDRRPRDSHSRSSPYRRHESPPRSRHNRSGSRESTRSGSSHYSSKSDRYSSSRFDRHSSGRPSRHYTDGSDNRSSDHRSSQNKTSRSSHDSQSHKRCGRSNRSQSPCNTISQTRSETTSTDVKTSENSLKAADSTEIKTVVPVCDVRTRDNNKNDCRNSNYRSERRHSRSPNRDRNRHRSRYSRSPDRYSHSSHTYAHEKSRYEDSAKEARWPTDETKDEDILKMLEDGQTYPGQEEEYDPDKLEESDVCLWVRCSPAELYYQRSQENASVLVGTPRLEQLQDRFRLELLSRAVEAEAKKPPYEMPPRKIRLKKMKSPTICGGKSSSSSSSDSSGSNSESSESEEDTALEELERKKKHPYRLHPELWYNDPGEMNDGPLCRCSAKAQRSGIRHGIYPGEEHLTPCDLGSNNSHRLHHYRVTMSPHTNFLSKFPTLIKHDSHEFIFEGFSMFSHASLNNLPPCKVIRFNIEYTVLYLEESFPENFTVEGLDLFSQFLFHDLLELVDLEWRAHNDKQGCQRFHFMPRFARTIEDGGKELLSLNVVLQYLLTSNSPLVPDSLLEPLTQMSQPQWQDWADQVKGMVVTQPGMKPCSLRVDQLDREQCTPGKGIFPEIIHFGIRPPQLSYAGNPSYQKAWRSYVKFRHLLANKPKVEYADRHKLLQKEMKLQEMRMKSNLKRDVTVVIGSKDFNRTGIMCDIVQHALLLPVLVCHLRLHQSLDILEENIGHPFQDRWLLQLALTHPSYRENFGTNPDHARNSLTNCGIRQPEYGDRRIHYMNTRKRGINTLINIMSRFGKREETLSHINHNERLEFLGDAVVEFLSSIHLFYMFPDLEEGGLATYRAAIVQNQHLAVLAKKLQLEKFMLYAHGCDLCHDLELRHAMANCFEALMGALFLDDGINVADKVFSETLFSEPELLDVWVNYPPHPLQEQELHGDRKWIDSVPLLKELHKFEEGTGIEFTHIRLLARAFTHRSVGFNNLTLGSNQRLEFLGDTVLQLVASEYLYKFFPEHHEGHLSLLRSSLVNNRTQSVVCDDLGMAEYAIYPHPKGELKTKDKADLLEAFLGALYVDKDLEFCRTFCQVCFFPRLQPFIMNQDWNDPKSKLQQCCLTLRSMDGGEPDIPVYKVIECKGPTNTRVYTVAVYFRGERLATGSGHSIQQAEMAAGGNALDSSKHLFPQLNHQKRVIERSVKQQVPTKSSRTKKKARRKKK